jgi:hypothetical protein
MPSRQAQAEIRSADDLKRVAALAEEELARERAHLQRAARELQTASENIAAQSEAVSACALASTKLPELQQKHILSSRVCACVYFRSRVCVYVRTCGCFR